MSRNPPTPAGGGEPFIASWSGGKDSCYAVMRAMRDGHRPVRLLNMMNENGKISRSHGLPPRLLARQAEVLRVPLVTVPASWGDYERRFTDTLARLRTESGATAAVFGDIDLQPHRDWEEKVCAAAGLRAMLPLWQGDRMELVRAMLDAGIVTVITSCRAELGEELIGRRLTLELAEALAERGVCPCGENGEFHTFVLDCPLFARPIPAPRHRAVRHEHYRFAEWEPGAEETPDADIP